MRVNKDQVWNDKILKERRRKKVTRGTANKLEENNKNKIEYERKLQELNEQIAISQNELSQETVSKKVKELEKYETKIEQNLDTHKKTLKFFKENDTYAVCTQSIDETFKEEKCNHENYQNFKTELGLKQVK